MGQIKRLRQKLTLHRAKSLRHNDTDAEARLWNALRSGRLDGMTWKRQVPFGPYILDFLCRDVRLVVEVDGSQHAEQIVYDTRRTVYLERAGLRVLRFWNSDVLINRRVPDYPRRRRRPPPRPRRAAPRGRGRERAGWATLM